MKIKRWGGRIVRSTKDEGLVPERTRGRVTNYRERIAVRWDLYDFSVVYDKDTAHHFMTFGGKRARS